MVDPKAPSFVVSCPVRARGEGARQGQRSHFARRGRRMLKQPPKTGKGSRAGPCGFVPCAGGAKKPAKGNAPTRPLALLAEAYATAKTPKLDMGCKIPPMSQKSSPVNENARNAGIFPSVCAKKVGEGRGLNTTNTMKKTTTQKLTPAQNSALKTDVCAYQKPANKSHKLTVAGKGKK